ncbi:MAG TPA: peptidoglycan recognition family protein [Pyrinomonadaceae bacterium]|nr:peptidoglycan recognition family protein [Pyrinomonadaceae bacterium]
MTAPARPTRLKLPAVALALLLACLAGLALPSYMNTMTPAGIVIHHTAVTTLGDGSPLDIEALDRIHERRGYGAFYWGRTYHIGYHYLILPDGTVQRGRPERLRGAHAQGFNDSVGVCLVGNFSSALNPNGERGLAEPTGAQMRALARLCRDIQGRYRIPPERVRLHKDVNPSTECPGDRLSADGLLSELAAAARRPE